MIPRLVVVLLAGLLPLLARASDAPVNYAGHYELVDTHPERVFRLDLQPSGSRFKLVFFAAITNQDGAQPKGRGLGRVNGDGVLEFTFHDDFGNEGTGTLTRTDVVSQSYHLEMRVTQFVDPGPLHFYGALTMHKISDAAPKSAVAQE